MDFTMDASNEAVRVVILQHRIGRLSLLLGGPCIDRLLELIVREEQNPTRELWIWWETSKRSGEEQVELVFGVCPRRRPGNRHELKPEPVARSLPLEEPARSMLKFLEVQSLVDCILADRDPNGDGTNPVYRRLCGIVASPSYDWDRMDARCEQFELGRKG